MISKIIEFVAKSPAVKTVISLASSLVSGILAGTFVYEISASGIIQWKDFYKTQSFYLIIFWGILVYCYNVLVCQKEKDILKYSDDGYCITYMRSQCVPEIALKAIKSIKGGNIKEFKNMIGEFKRFLE